MNRVRRRPLWFFRLLICFGNRNLNVDSLNSGAWRWKVGGWQGGEGAGKKGLQANDWIMVEVDSVNRYLASGILGIGSISGLNRGAVNVIQVSCRRFLPI